MPFKTKIRINMSGLTMLIIGAIALSFLYLILKSWFRWGDLIIDTPRELWIPEQILKGKIPYRDMFYPYGFLPPYLLAVFYAIFGINISSLAICGAAVTVLVCVLLYKISRLFLEEAESGLVVMTFLFVFAFGFYCYNNIFNFILPYSFASTLFLLFILAALYYFILFIRSEKIRYLTIWSACLCFAFFCRLDTSLTVWPAFLVMGVISMSKNDFVKTLLRLISPPILSLSVYLLFLAGTRSFAGFNESFIGNAWFSATGKASVFSINSAGLSDIAGNLALAFKSFFIYAAVLLTLGLLCRPDRLSPGEKDFYGYLPPIFFLIFFLFVLIMPGFNGFLQYRCMPVILTSGCLIISAGLFRGSDRKKDLSLLTLFVVSLILSSKIFLNSTPCHYGFYLLTPALVCFYIFFLGITKDMLIRYVKTDGRIFLSGAVFFFLLLIVPNWQFSWWMYDKKDVAVATDKGLVYCQNDNRTAAFWKTVEYMRNDTAEGSTLVVFPEGVSVNFFSGRNTPLKYSSFLPQEIEAAGEEKMIEEFERSAADYICILSRNTAEYGYPAFGFDYAKKIYAWIGENYDLVKQIGPFPNTSGEFGTAVFKKK